jgi:fucose permease
VSTNATEITSSKGTRDYGDIWSYTAGFLLLGILVGFISPLLVAWQYHIDGDPLVIGLHFLGLSGGYVAAVAASRRLLRKSSFELVGFIACILGSGSLALVTFLGPPLPVIFRILGLVLAGMAVGALATVLFRILECDYKHAAAKTLNQAAMLLGAGSLVATLTLGFSYLAGIPRTGLVLLATLPVAYLVICGRNQDGRRTSGMDTGESASLVRRIGVVLCTLLLFFQFGNEWAIAGWLPLFLIRRFGSSPGWAIFALAAYFVVLTLSRSAAGKYIPPVGRKKLLPATAVTTIAGCILISTTSSQGGAYLAILFIGIGFGPIYSLIAGQLDNRFSHRRGFYSGEFSVALAGGMCSPWLLGFASAYFGMQYVMLIPGLGSLLVLVLALLLMLDSRLMGRAVGSSTDNLLY